MSLFRNHKTCKHIYINNLPHTKISLRKNLFSRTKNQPIITNCGAPGCTNQSTTHPEKSFHRLPSLSKKKKRKRMRDSWMAKISQKLFPKELFICTDHFEPECFKRDLKVRFDFSEEKKLLWPF